VQLGDDLEVGGEHPQLGGGAELELAAFVDVEGLVAGVGLHPHAVAAGGALDQVEAVAHRLQAGRAEHALAGEALLAGELGLGEALEKLADLFLQGAVEGGGHVGVEAVELVERGVEHARQAVAEGDRALAQVGGQEGRVGLHVAKLEGFGEGRVAQGGADHAVFGKQAQIARRQLPQPLAPATGKVKRRPAVGDHQRHHLVQRAALGGQVRAAGFGRGEQLVGGVEIGREPHPQAVAEAIDLTMPGRCRQRHGVEVVEQQASAGRQGFLAVLVGAHAGRGHLAQLLAAAVGDAVAGVAELFDLGGQGAAAGGVEIAAHQMPDPAEHGAGEAHPVDGRVHLRAGLVEEVAVLDEHQRLGHPRRHRGEVGVAPVGVAEAMQRLAAAVGHVEAGAGLLAIGGEQAVAGVVE
jgi:hypothetical protein